MKQPSRIKIDNYLEKHGEILYHYDFGDDWRIRVVLEETVEDYYFGYPTLLAGEGVAPPEDVGGPSGYKEFLKIYQDPTHSDYLSTYAWAESMYYLPLDNEYAIGEEKQELEYGKTYLLAVYRQKNGDSIRAGYDYQDEEELKNMLNEHTMVCLLKIKLEET